MLWCLYCPNIVVKRVFLHEGVTRFGRQAKEVDFTVLGRDEDPQQPNLLSISRFHCFFTVSTSNNDSEYSRISQISITDVSSQGTSVNGNRLEKGKVQNLAQGDVIQMGTFAEFRLSRVKLTVVTSRLPLESKEWIEQAVTRLGGNIGQTVDHASSFLVVPDAQASPKHMAAYFLGVPIVRDHFFRKWIHTQKANEAHAKTRSLADVPCFSMPSSLCWEDANIGTMDYLRKPCAHEPALQGCAIVVSGRSNESTFGSMLRAAGGTVFIYSPKRLSALPDSRDFEIRLWLLVPGHKENANKAAEMEAQIAVKNNITIVSADAMYSILQGHESLHKVVNGDKATAEFSGVIQGEAVVKAQETFESDWKSAKAGSVESDEHNWESSLEGSKRLDRYDDQVLQDESGPFPSRESAKTFKKSRVVIDRK